MPRGVYPRHPRRKAAKAGVSTFTMVPKLAKARRPVELPKEPVEVLTEDDPTLGNVIKRITNTYNDREDQADRANYLKYLYEALDDIDDSVKTDEEV